MRLYSWLLANSYDRAMRKAERLCLAAWRAQLLSQATGELLEIGAGTGINLPHYRVQKQRLILSEPDRHMRARLVTRLSTQDPRQIQITAWPAEQLELPDRSVDTVVSTLVLCSVQNLPRALSELHRVLRPGGQLLFLEHVIASERRTQRWQKFWQPLWKRCCGNCHLTRDAALAMTEAGFHLEQYQTETLPGVPAIVRRTIRGLARKPATEVL